MKFGPLDRPSALAREFPYSMRLRRRQEGRPARAVQKALGRIARNSGRAGPPRYSFSVSEMDASIEDEPGESGRLFSRCGEVQRAGQEGSGPGNTRCLSRGSRRLAATRGLPTLSPRNPSCGSDATSNIVVAGVRFAPKFKLRHYRKVLPP